jgi:hypothetical protein
MLACHGIFYSLFNLQWFKLYVVHFLPAEDINAQDGAATGRLLSAGVPESIAYCWQPGAAAFHDGS